MLVGTPYCSNAGLLYLKIGHHSLNCVYIHLKDYWDEEHLYVIQNFEV